MAGSPLSLRAVASLLLLGLWRVAAFSTIHSIGAPRWIGGASVASKTNDCVYQKEVNSLNRFRRADLIPSGTWCLVSRDSVQTSRREIIPRVAFSFAAASTLFLPNPIAAKDAGGVWTPDTRLALEGGKVQAPVIGFGTYNTKPEQVTKAVQAALAEGMRGFDCAAEYGNEKEIGQALKQSGIARSELCITSKSIPEIKHKQPQYRCKRYEKVANAYQSKPRYAGRYLPTPPMIYGPTPPIGPQRSVPRRRFGPLPSYGQIDASELLGNAASVQVSALQQIESAGLPAPLLNQLELSPFNQRKDVAQWCNARRIALSSSSWSKLSNKETGAKNWPKLKEVAAAIGATPQQVLIAWSLQRSILCNPRSAAENDKDIETIQQNFSGMRRVVLSPAQLATVDAMDEGLLSGALGRTDGWTAQDVTGKEWDPTLVSR